MTTTTCPHCGTKAEWYTIPEVGLERCPTCFVGTRPTTESEGEADTKKATPKTEPTTEPETKKATPQTKSDAHTKADK